MTSRRNTASPNAYGVDVSAIKVGDFIVSRGEVTSLDPNDWSFPIRLASGFWPGRDDITTIEPAPLAIGDRVNTTDCNADDNPGTIKGIDGIYAWVRWDHQSDDNEPSSHRLSRLVRVAA